MPETTLERTAAPTLPDHRRPRRAWLVLAGFVVLSLGAGAIGSIATSAGLQGWYQSLTRPPLAPPAWVFAPVWTTLYVLIGTSAYLVWQRRHLPGTRRALALWGAQLAFNAAWSPLFFGLRAPGAALVEIVLMGGAIGAYTVSAARIRPAAAWCMAPYAAWTAFATYLNAGYWWLNR